MCVKSVTFLCFSALGTRILIIIVSLGLQIYILIYGVLYIGNKKIRITSGWILTKGEWVYTFCHRIYYPFFGWSYPLSLWFGTLRGRVVVVAQIALLCPTLCDPMDCSLPGCSFLGISQARILEWVAISFFRGSSRPRDWTHVSCSSCFGRRMFYHQAKGLPTWGKIYYLTVQCPGSLARPLSGT